MRIDRWCAGCAALLAGQVVVLAALPVPLIEPGNTVLHVLLYSALTLLLWIATDGRSPTLVVGGAMLLAAAAGPGFVVHAAACIVTGAGLLAFKRNPKCAESSPRSRGGMSSRS